jgi:hypothetical protein
MQRVSLSENWCGSSFHWAWETGSASENFQAARNFSAKFVGTLCRGQFPVSQSDDFFRRTISSQLPTRGTFVENYPENL